MAEPFDSIAASVADVIDRLARGEITETQAATALSPLLTAVNDGEFAQRVDEIVNVVGRITGLLVVEAPPSNTLGAPGSYAWDRLGKVFYGPKHPVTGWPAGDAMTEGPPGPIGPRGSDASVAFATPGELRAGTATDKAVSPKALFDAQVPVTKIDATTITLDLSTAINWIVVLTSNRTLGAPTNAKPGTTGTILLKQDATGSRTLAYASAWMPFGSVPSLSTAANAVDLLTFIVEASGKVRFTLAKGGSA